MKLECNISNEKCTVCNLTFLLDSVKKQPTTTKRNAQFYTYIGACRYAIHSFLCTHIIVQVQAHHLMVPIARLLYDFKTAPKKMCTHLLFCL